MFDKGLVLLLTLQLDVKLWGVRLEQSPFQSLFWASKNKSYLPEWGNTEISKLLVMLTFKGMVHRKMQILLQSAYF